MIKWFCDNCGVESAVPNTAPIQGVADIKAMPLEININVDTGTKLICQSCLFDAIHMLDKRTRDSPRIA